MTFFGLVAMLVSVANPDIWYMSVPGGASLVFAYWLFRTAKAGPKP